MIKATTNTEKVKMNYLFDDLKKESQHKGINIAHIAIPDYITANIKHTLLDFQADVMKNFLFLQNYSDQINKNHLMFNLATGSGKTLLMAMLVLYYYEEKKMNKFIFLVNQVNIISKTEDNFLNAHSAKYLFKQINIFIKHKNIEIKKVDNFSDQTENIEIIFTTINKIHGDLNNERENQITLDVLKEKNIVILSDESHHINADSKKWINKPLKPSWEKTVIQYLFNKNHDTFAINQNVLLEFTATITDHDNVIKKYAPITIFKLPLSDFSKQGYAKNCLALQFNWPNKQRIVLVLLLNWLRHEIALKNKILHFKPVILFCSKNIDHAEEEYSNFRALIDHLTISDFDFLQNIESLLDEKEVQKRPIMFLKKFLATKYDNVSGFERALCFIKDNFQEFNCLKTHSKYNNEDKYLNNLEAKENLKRAIFVVDKLKEGWDVLNLFDIVRLDYDDVLKKTIHLKTSTSYSTADIQLIGRASRYYPFNVDKIDQVNLLKYKRKFDGDFDNELVLLEEFYFHTYKDEAFMKIFDEATNESYDPVELQKFWFKETFDKTTNPFFNNQKLYINESTPINLEKENLTNILNNFMFRQSEDALTSIQEFNVEKPITNEKLLSAKLQDFDINLIQKAFNKINIDNSSYFWLKNLKTLSNRSSSINKVTSIFDFFKSYQFFEKEFWFKVDNNITSLHELSLPFQLNIVCQLLKQFHAYFVKNITSYRGTPLQMTDIKEIFKKPKHKLIKSKLVNDKRNQLILKELQASAWYISDNFCGTDEERNFIECFRDHILAKLQKKYQQVYLLRNEEVYKIYQFKHGVGFQPDFLLFLTMKDQSTLALIEPKGGDYLFDKDAPDQKDDTAFANQPKWGDAPQGKKQQFLFEIKKEEQLINNNYRLIGLPLFNKEHTEATFHKYVNEFLQLE